MPKVSVVLTSFNHEKYVCEAIDSVLNQTFADFELIIWDDASSDNSWHLIKQYTDPRIKAFRNEEQKRGIWGINKAISEIAMGEYIAIHHSDDVWEPEKLEKQVAFLEENTEVGAVFAYALAINEDSLPLENNAHIYSNIFSQKNRTRYEWLNHFFTKGNALCHPSVLIRKKCYEDCGLYRYGFAQLGDFDMWIRLCMKYEIHIMPDKLVRFRVRDNDNNSSADTVETRSRLYFESYLIFKNFIEILSFAELLLIFSGAAKYKSNNVEMIEFIWAMMLIEETEFHLARLLSLEILFNILNDPVSSKKVSDDYGFNSVKFVDLTRQYGIANISVISYEAELYQLNMVIKEKDMVIKEKDMVIKEKDELLIGIVSSASWKMTSPLRYMKKTFYRLLRL